MPGVDYCRSHYPWKAKRPSLIVGAIIGAIISLGLLWVCDALTTSKAEARITQFDALAGRIGASTATHEAVDKFLDDYALLTSMVYRNVGLACQSWKSAYLVLRPDAAEDTNARAGDAWDMLDGTSPGKFSVQTWERYRPLFGQVVDEYTGQLDDIMEMHGALLAPDFEMLVTETKESLKLAQRTYTFARMMSDAPNREPFFAYSFRETSRAVSKLARESERRESEWTPKTD
jgi:hypothetical protein